jgi:hypothetical protein
MSSRQTKPDARLKRSFPTNLDEWKIAIPEYEKSGRGESLNILGFQVMQSWETPLMKAMASAACRENDVTLEIGFGLGICTGELQLRQPRLHVIVECNRYVADKARQKYQYEIEAGRIIVIDGFWQDLCEAGMLASSNLKAHLGIDGFDSIIFDAYPLSADQVGSNELVFFKDACRLLVRRGRFTYFSNEERTIGYDHQRAIKSAFSEANVSFSRVEVAPWLDCEYWSASEILNIVITKEALQRGSIL